jgi:hypothetical protein
VINISDTSTMVGIIFFVAFLIGIGTLGVSVITGFNPVLFGGELAGVGIACASASVPVYGIIACGGAVALLTISNLFLIPNNLLGTFVFVPLALCVAYVVARLIRGQSG